MELKTTCLLHPSAKFVSRNKLPASMWPDFHSLQQITHSYVHHNKNQQLKDPREIVEAFKSYFSTINARINTDLLTLPRLTDETLASILFNTGI